MKNGKPSKFQPILEQLSCVVTPRGNIIQPLNLGHRRIYGNFGQICDSILILNVYYNACNLGTIVNSGHHDENKMRVSGWLNNS